MATLPTLTSNTIEGALLEVANLLQEAERALTPARDNVQINIDFDAREATISATLPVSFTNSSTGITVAATPYA